MWSAVIPAGDGRSESDTGPPMLPSPQDEPERYKGRPLLIILENYVLACIGALPPDADSRIAGIVKTAFGGEADWQKTVRQVLELGDSIDESLRLMWDRNQEIARRQQIDLHPVQFAKMVVDQNFAHLIAKVNRAVGLCAVW